MAETRQSRTASQKFMPVYIVASCGSGHKKKIPVSELNGQGTEEWRTDASQAFDLPKRVHHPSGREVRVATTSCRTVSFETLKAEIQAGSLLLLESGMTSIIPDFPTIMYAVVKRAPA